MMKKFCFFTITLFMMMPLFVSAQVKIDDTIYETLDEAVANVKEGETITLLDDVDITDTSKYDAYYNWYFPDGATLDLNQHTIFTGRILTKNGWITNSVFLGDHLTIKNGNFVSRYYVDEEEKDADYSLFVGDEITTSNITLEDLNVESGINIYNALNVTLKNVTTSGRDYYAVWLDEHATATILSGNYSTRGVTVVGITSTKDFNSELTIKGGTFQAKKGKLSLSETSTNTQYLPPIISGGIYDYDVTEFVKDGYVCKEQDGHFVVSEKEYDRDVHIDDQYQVDQENIGKVLLDTILSTKEISVDKKDIDIVLNIDETKVSESVSNHFQEAIKDGHIANYFDITIDVLEKSTNTSLGKLTTLNDKIVLGMMIPEEMKVLEGYTRTYYVLREHDGVIDILNTTLKEDGKSLTFATDKFSTYALAYVDVKKEEEKPPVEDPSEEKPSTGDKTDTLEPDIENPKTGDHIVSYIFIVGFFALAIVACHIYLNRRELLKKDNLRL